MDHQRLAPGCEDRGVHVEVQEQLGRVAECGWHLSRQVKVHPAQVRDLAQTEQHVSLEIGPAGLLADVHLVLVGLVEALGEARVPIHQHRIMPALPAQGPRTVQFEQPAPASGVIRGQFHRDLHDLQALGGLVHIGRAAQLLHLIPVRVARSPRGIERRQRPEPRPQVVAEGLVAGSAVTRWIGQPLSRDGLRHHSGVVAHVLAENPGIVLHPGQFRRVCAHRVV